MLWRDLKYEFYMNVVGYKEAPAQQREELDGRVLYERSGI